jgi:hypothetical protein
MAFRTLRIVFEDNGLCPVNLTARSTPPSSPDVDDVYLDDGTNYGGGCGIPGLRRWTGAEWEDLGMVGSGITNLDGGHADTDFGGVGLSPLDGGGATSF